MDRTILSILVFIVVTSVAYYFWQDREAKKILSDEQQSRIEVPAPVVKKASPEAEIRYPVSSLPQSQEIEPSETTGSGPVAQPEPLPDLEDSDTPIKALLQEIYVPEKLDRILVFVNFIRHFVVTVDNLDGRKLARRYSITRPPSTTFLASKLNDEEEYIIAATNEARYEPYMRFLGSVSDQQLVRIYVRFYPLFQRAYEELGYPDRYFNDRFIEIIDHLLSTPKIDADIKLVRPKVYYEFADSKLEDLSAGQKLLIRIGKGNAKIVRERLGGLRSLLTGVRS